MTQCGHSMCDDDECFVREPSAPSAQAEIARLTAEVERLEKANATWRQNSIDTWSAMNAMRNAINEHVPIPSLESDLLQGPENSIFYETVSRAVIEHVARLTAERDTIAADAFEAAGKEAAMRCAACGVSNIGSLVREYIKRLTPADALAARETRDRAKVAEGLREAGAVCMREDVGATYECCHEAIIARAAEMEAGK